MAWKTLKKESAERKRTEKSVEFKLSPEKKKASSDLEELKATMSNEKPSDDAEASIPDGFYDKMSLDGFTVQTATPSRKKGILRNAPSKSYSQQQYRGYRQSYQYESYQQQARYRQNPAQAAMRHQYG